MPKCGAFHLVTEDRSSAVAKWHSPSHLISSLHNPAKQAQAASGAQKGPEMHVQVFSQFLEVMNALIEAQ